ncbi:hypothetical protein GJAV_G00040200 [Gymnothorax javanicus]|nr:hypothetical protein GJAV_G00040200 [Gymnothorax javanicus]
MGSGWFQLIGVSATSVLCMLCLVRGEDSVVHVKIGGAVELGCSLSPAHPDATAPPLFPLHVVEWVRRDFDVPVLIKFGPYAPRVHPSFEGRVSLSRGAALLVEQVELQDEGWFECRLLHLNGTSSGSDNGTWIFLSVSAPPVFTSTPPPIIDAMQGNSLSLTCSAHGNPRPIITWTKDDMSVEKDGGTKAEDGTLTIGAVTREMAGVYKCHVSNSEGSLSYTTKLRVKGPPVILRPPKDTTLNISQNAQLQCRAEAYPPNMTYVWWKQGENVYHIDSLKSRVKILVDGTLLIPRLTPEDSGNYTCMPTNGLLKPPSATASLTVKHPAQVLQMPPVTYLPAGMGGRIICPVRAEPPLLSVSWTKDGRVLDLDMFPGWMLMANGSLFIATANEDAVGSYTCTPYNSYGTMGPSAATQVVLQDPPVFSVLPREEYEQEVNSDLVIPCHAHGNPSPSITWAKAGSSLRSPFKVADNGSLVLQPLSKDHHGAWKCFAANRVATITANTRVSVLGTTPHAVASLQVDPGTDQATCPGYRGLMEDMPRNSLSGLLPGTGYQFSVLPQNQVGTGPFGEVATVQTLVPFTEQPRAVATVPELAPPELLSANQSSIGIVLKWAPPQTEGPPITGFILQSRREGEEEWRVLKGDIAANDCEILLQGLQKDCSYELRMLSRRDGLVSAPSQPLNISTAGMAAFPVRLRESDALPHNAGVLAGLTVLCVLVLLLLGTACFLNREKRRLQRRRRRENIPGALQKCQPGKSATLPDSPESIVKIKACLLNTVFPRFSTSRHDRSTDGSSSEGQDQGQRLLPQPRSKSRLLGCRDIAPTATLESISRGPDGRFTVQPCQDGSNSGCIQDVAECTQGGGVSKHEQISRWDCSRSCSLCSEKDDLAVVLSVDLPDTSHGSCSDSESSTENCDSMKCCSRMPGDPAGAFLQWGEREGRAGFLPQDKAWELVDGRTLVTQMEWERESGHLTRCLTLAREREELEKELERCEARLSLRAWRREAGEVPAPKDGYQAPNQVQPDSNSHLHLNGKDRPQSASGGGRHSVAHMVVPNASAASCTQKNSEPISSISSCVLNPHQENNAWPRDVDAGHNTLPTFPTNRESTCLISDDLKAGRCLWRASTEVSDGKRVSKPTVQARSQDRKWDTDSFGQNSPDRSQWRFSQGGNEEVGWDVRGHSPGSTWPYRRGGGGGGEHRTGVAETLKMTQSTSSQNHLWKSSKSLTNGQSVKSSLSGLIDDDSNKTDFSISQISGSLIQDLMPQSHEAAQQHKNSVLKFLSLPGFVEMNVDEPMREEDTTPVSSGLHSSQRPRNTTPSRLKEGPVAWAGQTLVEHEAALNQSRVAPAKEAPPKHSSLRSTRGALSNESHRFPAEPRGTGSCGRMRSSEKRLSGSDRTLRRPLKRSQSLTWTSKRGEPLTPPSAQTGNSDLHGGRPSWTWSSGQDSDQMLASTSHDLGSQDSRIHLSPSVCDPVPKGHFQSTTGNMNKTLRRGPTRTHQEGLHNLTVRKSASLSLKTREHGARGERPVSQTSSRANFPSPEVWVRSLSLGSTSKSRPKPPRSRHHNSGEPFTRSLTPVPLPLSMEHKRLQKSPDPRRQAGIFPEAPISYREALPPLQLNSGASHCLNTPPYPSSPSNSSQDHPRPVGPSWSQPERQPLTQREPSEDRGVEHGREVGQSVEDAVEGSGEEEGRSSYASQSSGRGSLDPRPTPSPSPTLPNSQEHPQEGKAGGRRRASVDENYEWDATNIVLESDPLKAPYTHPNQAELCKNMEGQPCPEALLSEGDPLSLSSCVVKYQHSPMSPSSGHLDLDTVLF